MQQKERVIIKIESIALGGEGVGRINNFVIFIPFAAPGDELEIEITLRKKKFARGKIIKIIKASPLRVMPLCEYYEICGGCCYQHINYASQLEIKKRQVEEAFRKIGKILSPPVGKSIASPQYYNYRGKANFHRMMTKAGLMLGFLDVSGGKIVDVQRCELMEETINDKISGLRENAVTRHVQDARLNIWSDLCSDDIGDTDRIRRVVSGKEFLVPDDGFFQANLFLTELLVEEVCRLATAGQINNLIDAYCGCGLFAIFLAPLAEKVIGIELNEKSIKFAQINAERENIKNIKFICGDTAETLTKEDLSFERGIDVLILDPPRIGCSELLLRSIISRQPRKIIYVSCNPATQARDVKFLNDHDYDLLSLLPIDMFPQTQHIEVIGLLEHKINSHKVESLPVDIEESH